MGSPQSLSIRFVPTCVTLGGSTETRHNCCKWQVYSNSWIYIPQDWIKSLREKGSAWGQWRYLNATLSCLPVEPKVNTSNDSIAVVMTATLYLCDNQESGQSCLVKKFKGIHSYIHIHITEIKMGITCFSTKLGVIKIDQMSLIIGWYVPTYMCTIIL